MKNKTLTLISTFALFTTMTFADISPINGTWKPEIIENQTSSCPDTMTSMLEKQKMPAESKSMKFSKPFHPSSLFKEAGQLIWNKTATNKWEASIINNGSEGMNVTWKLNVISPKRIDVHANVSIKMGSDGTCQSDTVNSFNYVTK